MAEIVISEFMDESAVESLKKEFSVLYDKTLVDRPEDLEAAVSAPDCRAIIVRNRTQVRGKLLASAAHLVAVGRLGVGLDNIDVPACKERGISVLPATGANSVAVAEYVMGSLFVLARGVFQNSAAVAHGDWPREKMNKGGEIAGKTLGCIGFGDIARNVCVRARACGMTVIASDPFLPTDSPVWKEFGATPVTLEELLAQSDAVTLHIPLTEGTRHLINAERLASMKKGAILINSARGGIVDEDALADALVSGHLAGAAMDVFSPEPLPAGSKLGEAPNCILTPHIAGLTRESNTRVSSVTAERVAAALKA